jgi:mannose-6-phosphate isomerase-like protein (cupin superfamily)
MIRYAKLPLVLNVKAVQSELSNLKGEWQAHFNRYHYEGSWTVLALRSPGGSDKNIIPDLLSDSAYEDTAFMESFPSVAELLSGFNCEVMAVRLLNLQAGAIIKPHRDQELAFEKGEARLHFPVITNDGVKFYIENERIPLQEGDCWYMNANLIHSVANEGDTDRIHLVIDCKVNDWLSDMIMSSEVVSVKAEVADNSLYQVIEELRLQNTASSLRLAAEMELQLNETFQDKNIIT